MKKARDIAMATYLKEEEDETYFTFLVEFINMRIDFIGHEEQEVQMLLKMHEELYVQKKKIDDRGKLFEHLVDDRSVKIESIKYELLKRTNRKQECLV